MEMLDEGHRQQALSGTALRRAIVDVVERHLPPKSARVFLSGSEASGTARPGADVDVALLGAEAIPLRTIEKIREELERLRTLRAFDVVDLCTTSESFRSDVERHGVLLNG